MADTQTLCSSLGYTEEQLNEWIKEGRKNRDHDSHYMVDGKVPFQVARVGKDRYAYLPETRQYRMATTGSDQEKELEADLIDRAWLSEEYADQLAWRNGLRNCEQSTLTARSTFIIHLNMQQRPVAGFSLLYPHKSKFFRHLQAEVPSSTQWFEAPPSIISFNIWTVKECLKNMVAAISKGDLRIFAGVQEGKAVVVRAQRLPKEPRALVIVQSEDRTRVIWHKNFSKYRIDMYKTEWYLRLRLEEASIEEPLDIMLPDIVVVLRLDNLSLNALRTYSLVILRRVAYNHYASILAEARSSVLGGAGIRCKEREGSC